VANAGMRILFLRKPACLAESSFALFRACELSDTGALDKKVYPSELFGTVNAPW
jgi:hypothetical protein